MLLKVEMEVLCQGSMVVSCRLNDLSFLMTFLLQAKQNLIEVIENFQHERIVLAAKAISEDYAYNIIEDGDVILVYAWYVQLFLSSK